MEDKNDGAVVVRVSLPSFFLAKVSARTNLRLATALHSFRSYICLDQLVGVAVAAQPQVEMPWETPVVNGIVIFTSSSGVIFQLHIEQLAEIIMASAEVSYVHKYI